MPIINTTPDSSQRAVYPVRKPFEEWTRADALLAVAWMIARRVGREGFEANRAFVEDHNHFQRGDGWIGPQGADNIPARSRVSSNVERQFTPVDSISEVLDNVANALLQSQPNITLEPLVPVDPDTPEADAQETETAALLQTLSTYLIRRLFWPKVREAVKRSRWATWGALRVWVPDPTLRIAVAATKEPKEEMVGTLATSEESSPESVVNLPTGLSLEEALSWIDVSAPLPDQAMVYRDPDTQHELGIFLYTDQLIDMVELCWVDEQNRTQFRRMTLAETEGVSTDLDLGGFLSVQQIEAELLVTEPVRMQQAQLNFANSVMTRVMETAGFPERAVIDAEPEGDWELTAPPNTMVLATKVDAQSRTWYLVPREGRTLGANIVNEIRSMTDPSNNGETARSAQFIKLDPTDPDYIIKAIKQARATLLRQCKQGHLEMDDQASASGFARIQARVIHLADVSALKSPLIALITHTLMTVLKHAAVMSPEAAALLAKYKVAVAVNVSLGPVDPQDRTAILEMLKANAISLTTALALLQVEDVNAEVERIRNQPESQRAELKAQADLMAVFVGGCGFSGELAAELAGLTPEQLAIIQKHQNAAPPTPPPMPGLPIPARGNGVTAGA